MTQELFKLYSNGSDIGIQKRAVGMVLSPLPKNRGQERLYSDKNGDRYRLCRVPGVDGPEFVRIPNPPATEIISV